MPVIDLADGLRFSPNARGVRLRGPTMNPNRRPHLSPRCADLGRENECPTTPALPIRPVERSRLQECQMTTTALHELRAPICRESCWMQGELGDGKNRNAKTNPKTRLISLLPSEHGGSTAIRKDGDKSLFAAAAGLGLKLSTPGALRMCQAIAGLDAVGRAQRGDQAIIARQAGCSPSGGTLPRRCSGRSTDGRGPGRTRRQRRPPRPTTAIPGNRNRAFTDNGAFA